MSKPQPRTNYKKPANKKVISFHNFFKIGGPIIVYLPFVNPDSSIAKETATGRATLSITALKLQENVSTFIANWFHFHNYPYPFFIQI